MREGLRQYGAPGIGRTKTLRTSDRKQPQMIISNEAYRRVPDLAPTPAMATAALRS